MRRLHRHLSCFRDLTKLAQKVNDESDAEELADQLYAFLSIKTFVAKANLNLQVSPCPKVDDLWHRMLLETRIRDSVHEALGGDVPHSASDSDLPDVVKAVRRLAAMTLMELDGWHVRIDLWREPHTLMQDVIRMEDASGVVVYASGLVPRSEGRHIVSMAMYVLGECNTDIARRLLTLFANDSKRPAARRALLQPAYNSAKDTKDTMEVCITDPKGKRMAFIVPRSATVAYLRLLYKY